MTGTNDELRVQCSRQEERPNRKQMVVDWNGKVSSIDAGPCACAGAGRRRIGWNEEFDDWLGILNFFLIASPVAGAALGMGRLVTEANSRAKLMPIKMN